MLDADRAFSDVVGDSLFRCEQRPGELSLTLQLHVQRQGEGPSRMPLEPVEGVDALHAVEHTVIPDRIEAATYHSAVGMVGGRITVDGARADHMDMLISKLREMGVKLESSPEGLTALAPDRLRSVDVATLSGILSSACLIHFVVRYARLPCETLVIRTSYAAATGYLILLGAGGWWTSPPGVHGTARVFDLEVNTFFSEATPLASSFYAALGLVLVATVVVLGRLYLSGRTESKGAFIGKVHDDELGEVFRHDIRALGVAFDTAANDSGPPTAMSMILVTPDA
jgi:hypothetical protein